MREDDVASKLAVHEAVCAERLKQANDRLGRIEVVLAAIVLLLLVGEGTVRVLARNVSNTNICASAATLSVHRCRVGVQQQTMCARIAALGQPAASISACSR